LGKTHELFVCASSDAREGTLMTGTVATRLRRAKVACELAKIILAEIDTGPPIELSDDGIEWIEAHKAGG
jgi:hypothetical protein